MLFVRPSLSWISEQTHQLDLYQVDSDMEDVYKTMDAGKMLLFEFLLETVSACKENLLGQTSKQRNPASNLLTYLGELLPQWMVQAFKNSVGCDIYIVLYIICKIYFFKVATLLNH